MRRRALALALATLQRGSWSTNTKAAFALVAPVSIAKHACAPADPLAAAPRPWNGMHAAIGTVPATLLRSARHASSTSAPPGRVVSFPLAQTGEGISECELVTWHVKVRRRYSALLPCPGLHRRARVGEGAGQTGGVGAFRPPMGWPQLVHCVIRGCAALWQQAWRFH